MVKIKELLSETGIDVNVTDTLLELEPIKKFKLLKYDKSNIHGHRFKGISSEEGEEYRVVIELNEHFQSVTLIEYKEKVIKNRWNKDGIWDNPQLHYMPTQNELKPHP